MIVLNRPYFNPDTGITGTPAQHAEATRKKREKEASAAQDKAFQQQQTQNRQSSAQTTQASYGAGQPSAAASGYAARSAANTSNATGAGYSVDPYGHVSFDDSAEQARRTSEEADARKLRTLTGLMSRYGSSDREAAPGTVQHGGAGINADEAAARAAAFGRAKDQTGLVTRSAVDSLRSLYAGTGNTGAQRQGLENIVAGGAGALNEFTRDQLMSDLERAGDVSDMVYQGNITQRGQDINRPFNPQLQALIGLMGTLY